MPHENFHPKSPKAMERCRSCSQTKRFNMAIMVMMVYHHHHPLHHHHNHRHHHHHPSTKGCCSSPHTKRCCLASGIIGSLVLLVGLVLMVAGRFFPHLIISNNIIMIIVLIGPLVFVVTGRSLPHFYYDNCPHCIHHSPHYCLHYFHFSRGLLEGAILKSMALKEGSGRWNDNWQPPDYMLIVSIYHGKDFDDDDDHHHHYYHHLHCHQDGHMADTREDEHQSSPHRVKALLYFILSFIMPRSIWTSKSSFVFNFIVYNVKVDLNGYGSMISLLI